MKVLTRLEKLRPGGISIVKSSTPISPLSVPEFKKIWIATVQSHMGVQIQALGAAWMMISLEATSQFVALVSVVIAAPTLMFSLFAGSVADSRDRKGVMLAAQGLILVASLALTALAYLGELGAFSLGAVYIDVFRRLLSTEALLRLAALVLATGMLTISLNRLMIAHWPYHQTFAILLDARPQAPDPAHR